MTIRYIVDEATGLYYERLEGQNVPIEEVIKQLINPQHTAIVATSRMVICDLRRLSVISEDEQKFQAMLEEHAYMLENIPAEFSRFAISVAHTNETFIAAHLRRQLSEIKNVRVKMFLGPENVEEYIGFDVSRFFALWDRELTELSVV